MDSIHDDVLIQIFLEHIGRNPVTATPLLEVCRRWYSLITTTPILWSTVELHLISTRTIPNLLSAKTTSGKSGLEMYLSRSEFNGARALLDIQITWMASEDPTHDHNKQCVHAVPEANRCISSFCGYQSRCDEQIKSLLMVLAGISSPTSSSTSPPVPQSSLRLERWRSFYMNCQYHTIDMNTKISFEPLNNLVYRASNLISLTLVGLDTRSPGPHPEFAPKLMEAVLRNCKGDWITNLTTVRKLKLGKFNTGLWSRGRKEPINAANVRNLHVGLPPDDITSGIFPRLQSIFIEGSIGDILLECLELPAKISTDIPSMSVSASSRRQRLNYLALCGAPHTLLLKMSKGTYFTNARFIRIITTINLDRDSFTKALATFISKCAEDTKFEPWDKQAGEVLAEARRINEAKN